MTKSAYYKRMNELATRLKKCKEKTADRHIASFYGHAAEQFAKKHDELKPNEVFDPVDEERINILFKYEETVAGLEVQVGIDA